MSEQKIGFIGIGNMASAILNGILSAFFTNPENLYMYNPHPEKMQHFVESGCTACESVAEIVENCPIIFLCIKPQIFPEVLKNLQPMVANKKENDVLFVSIAAGVSSKNIRDMLGETRRIVRAMPNTPLLLGAGATALCRTGNVSDAAFETIQRIFSCCGVVREITEPQMDAVIPVSGSSPAYIYRLAQLTCDYAARAGMDADTALALFSQTLSGCAEMLMKSGKDPQALIDMVTSKGGTTFALLHSLDADGFNDVMTRSFEACEKRAGELAL